jgi:hypothetical protein
LEKPLVNYLQEFWMVSRREELLQVNWFPKMEVAWTAIQCYHS